MKIEDYFREDDLWRRMNFLETQSNLWNKWLSEEKLFLEYIKSSKFKIEKIVHEKDNLEFGKTIVYTPDFSLMEDFNLREYKIDFISKIKVNGQILSNYEIQLDDEEMFFRNYNKILIGKYSWRGADYKEVNEKNVKLVHQSIDFFKKKGMRDDLVKKVGEYMLRCAEGYDPYDTDPRL